MSLNPARGGSMNSDAFKVRPYRIDFMDPSIPATAFNFYEQPCVGDFVTIPWVEPEVEWKIREVNGFNVLLERNTPTRPIPGNVSASLVLEKHGGGPIVQIFLENPDTGRMCFRKCRNTTDLQSLLDEYYRTVATEQK